MKKQFFLSILTLPLSGCIALTSVSMSNVIRKGGNNPQHAEVSGLGILGLTVPDSSALEVEALKQLRAKGVTKNITTRLTMRNWGVVQYYSVVATGSKAGGKSGGGKAAPVTK